MSGETWVADRNAVGEGALVAEPLLLARVHGGTLEGQVGGAEYSSASVRADCSSSSLLLPNALVMKWYEGVQTSTNPN